MEMCLSSMERWKCEVGVGEEVTIESEELVLFGEQQVSVSVSLGPSLYELRLDKLRGEGGRTIIGPTTSSILVCSGRVLLT